MAIHVDSGGSNTSPYETWAKAATSMETVDSVAAAGEVIKVEYRFSETYTVNTTLDFVNGTVAAPVEIVSCDKDNSDAYRAGALIKSDNGDNTYTRLLINGNIRSYGVDYRTRDGNFYTNDGSNDTHQSYYDCTMGPEESPAAWIEQYAMSLSSCRFEKVTVPYGATPMYSLAYDVNKTEWIGCDLTGSTSGYFITQNVSARGNQVILRGCKITLAGTQDLVSMNGNRNGVIISHCNITGGSQGVTVPAASTSWVSIENCDDGTITAPPLGIWKRTDGYGDTENAVSTIYRTSGANDSETNYCWKMVSNASAAERLLAHESPPITRWVAAGSQTLTLYLAGGATLNDDDFWIEVISPNETASPNQTAEGAYRTTRTETVLNAIAPLDTDSVSTWNGAGVDTKQKIDVPITPTEPGPVTVRCFLAKPSTTVYVDPVIAVDGNTSGDSFAVEGVQLNKAAIGGSNARHPLARF